MHITSLRSDNSGYGHVRSWHRPVPIELTIEVEPTSRLDLINMRHQPGCESITSDYTQLLFCSLHTTAGYFDQALLSQLRQTNVESLQFMQLFRRLFPEGADYRHDHLELRRELTDSQRDRESRNADAHLIFMAAGMEACVGRNLKSEPVYFIDLDGVQGLTPRRRVTRVLAFNDEEVVAHVRVEVPMPNAEVSWLSLKSTQAEVYSTVKQLILRHSITRGLAHLMLSPEEREAALTTNESETLLMDYDMTEVLRDPLRFAFGTTVGHIQCSSESLRHRAPYDGRKIGETVGDLCRSLGIADSMIPAMVRRVTHVNARGFLHMKRRLSFFVSDLHTPGRGTIIEGVYQSPILVQWGKAKTGHRSIDIVLTRIH